MSKRTAGSWTWKGTMKNPKRFCYLTGKDGVLIGRALDGFTENKADARLIASAPELLEALEECVRELAAHEAVCEAIRKDKMPCSKPFQPSEAMNKATKALKKVYAN